MDNLPPSPTGTTAPKTRPDDAFRHGFFFAFGAALLALLLFMGWKFLEAVLAVSAPFIGAIVLSLLLEPLVRWVQARITRGHRMRAVLLVFLVFLSFFGGIIAYGGPILIDQSQRLIRFFTPVTYVVMRNTGNTGGDDKFVTVTSGIAGTTFTVKNLVNDASYQFIVYAVNADGAKFASPVTTCTPRADADMAEESPDGKTTDGKSNSNESGGKSSTGKIDGQKITPVAGITLPPDSPQSLTAVPGNGAVRLTWLPPVQGQSGFDQMRKSVDKWLGSHQKMGPVTLPKNVDALVAQYSDQVSHSLQMSAGRLTSVVAASLGGLITAILIPIISIFVLADIDRLRARMYLFLPESARKFTQTTMEDIGEVFGKYLRGLVIICSMYGGACMVYLLAISIWFPGMRGYAVVLGVLAGVLYSVPYVGAISTVLITAVAAFSTGAGFGGAAIAAGGVLALNQIFDYVVMPKVVGETSGIHPLLAMFALFLGGHLFGLWGMLLAVPIAASIQGVLFRLYPQLAAPTPISLLYREEKRDQVEEAARRSRASQEDVPPPHTS